jgi:shikimate kinase
MLSKTDLGIFLHGVYSGLHPELKKPQSALALATLLLADASIACSDDLLAELRRVLTFVYGDSSFWRCHEEPPNADIRADLEQILTSVNASGYEKASAYLSGLLGRPQIMTLSNESRKVRHIHAKCLRIFYKGDSSLARRDQHLFFCLIGLKGSGKSSILRLLEKEGKEVLEVYRDLDKIRIEDETAVAHLPPRTEWEDEPLRLCLEKRGISDSSEHRRIFVGSLLRRSEIDLFAELGKVVLVHIHSPNEARHIRAKNRGREIEKLASNDRLVELDAHRDGLWPEYEQNDLGGLVDLCQYSLVNDKDTSLESLCHDVRVILEKEV